MKNCESDAVRVVSQIKRHLLATLILFVSVSAATGARTERVVESWKPLNYRVFLTFNDQLTQITNARTEITILSLTEALSKIDLDFGEMPVDSVTVNNETVAFERAPSLLIVMLSQPAPRGTRLRVDVTYHGTPKDGLVLTTDKSGKPSAVGDNWPNRVHHWIPCLDHPSAKATVTFSVTAPARETVVANGKLDHIETSSNTARTWIWNEGVPIPPYCMIVAVGEFAQQESTSKEITSLAYYVPQIDREFANKGFAPATPSLKFFSQTIAPYPYEKLALIIGATRFGGMENSSAIVFPGSLFDSRPGTEQISTVFNIREGIVDVVAHEIAHQWFGDSVTESTWSDLWLSEGFATYFAGLFIQRYEGEKAFQQYMKNAAGKYFSYEKKTRTPIHDDDTEDLFKLLNANNYQKGAWVLHMLRSELGDEKFFRGIRSYYGGHRNSTATTEDLRSALEKSSGRNLKLFFDRWIYEAGHPEYQISWEWKSKQKSVRVVLTQLQSEPAFPNAVPVEILTASGKRRVVLKPRGKQTIAWVKLNDAPATVNIDPDNTVLKEVVQNQ